MNRKDTKDARNKFPLASNPAPQFPVLETERLILREMQPEDAPDLLDVLSDLRVTQHTAISTLQPGDEGKIVHGIVRAKRAFERQDRIIWGITLKTDGRVMGRCGFELWHKDYAYAELGYFLGYPYWGRGIMTETVAACVDYGFEQMQLNRVQAWILGKNLASAKVLTKNGFQFEGILREQGFWKEAFHNLHMYAVLKREFEALNKE